MLHLLDHIKSDRPPEDDDSAISDQWTVEDN
jgi:ribosome-binding factor A